MTKALTQPTKETPKQRGAFLLYFNLGGERSIRRVRQELAKKRIKISETSVKKWSMRYKWVERVQRMDQEVADRSEELAIKHSTTKKSDILKAVKNTFIKYNQALLDGDVVPTAKDFRQMWEIQRKELGLDVEAPSAIKIEINQRILSIVAKAEEEAYKVIQEDIGDE